MMIYWLRTSSFVLTFINGYLTCLEALFDPSQGHVGRTTGTFFHLDVSVDGKLNSSTLFAALLSVMLSHTNFIILHKKNPLKIPLKIFSGVFVFAT